MIVPKKNSIFAEKKDWKQLKRYKTKVKVSIIIPVFNVSLFVKRCIESVMEQDQAEADLECIIVDDCGQDDSMEIVRQTMSNYSGPIRFILVEHEHNRGLSAARNTGLANATGDYVLFVDSDDYLMSGSIQYFIDNLKQHPKADVLVGNYRKGTEINAFQGALQEPCCIDNPTHLFQLLLRRQIYVQTWNKLMRRQLLVERKLSFIEGILFEDEPWSYRLYSCVSSVVLLPKVTYVYEDNMASITHTAFTQEKAKKALCSFIVVVNNLLDYPPVLGRYEKDVTVDYLLLLNFYLTKAVDLHTHFSFPAQISQDFLAVRRRMLFCSLRRGRIMIFFFSLLLFFPLSYLQKLRLFRQHYKQLEVAVNRLSHMTDFLHRH